MPLAYVGLLWLCKRANYVTRRVHRRLSCLTAGCTTSWILCIKQASHWHEFEIGVTRMRPRKSLTLARHTVYAVPIREQLVTVSVWMRVR